MTSGWFQQLCVNHGLLIYTPLTITIEIAIPNPIFLGVILFRHFTAATEPILLLDQLAHNGGPMFAFQDFLIQVNSLLNIDILKVADQVLKLTISL